MCWYGNRLKHLALQELSFSDTSFYWATILESYSFVKMWDLVDSIKYAYSVNLNDRVKVVVGASHNLWLALYETYCVAMCP